MAHYVFGDIQGCFTAFQQLLDKINFNPVSDHLTFCGDIMNRGGQSLEMLRWTYANQYCCRTVLGNHDLSILSKYFIPEFRTDNPEIERIFEAKDVSLMMNWLLGQPLLIEFKSQIVIHAGVYPSWNLPKLKLLTRQAQKQMTEQPVKFFKQMYGDKPDLWVENLSQQKANRFVINTVSRMRFLDSKNRLNLTEKG
ncbi:MAG: symmetrical bis(5'-nucleosyl)-tetraphosphatase, partial [Proteobacteria bacterium]|nr:symmetrical bis(5'-nucleosyl)-tetraphosphatase [Pseudomonadota bacterium]